MILCQANTIKQQQVYLPVSRGVAVHAGQRGQAQVTGPASGHRLHEERLVGAEVDDSHLVMQQLGNKKVQLALAQRKN